MASQENGPGSNISLKISRLSNDEFLAELDEFLVPYLGTYETTSRDENAAESLRVRLPSGPGPIPEPEPEDDDVQVVGDVAGVAPAIVLGVTPRLFLDGLFRDKTVVRPRRRERTPSWAFW